MNAEDFYNLNRFLEAQEEIYFQALSEIRGGQKRSHWMWFIFPQLDGLAFSSTAKHFAIKSAEEATAYLAHSVLGPRLLECTTAVLELEGLSANQIFSSPDDLKLKSCATLFAFISPPNSAFEFLLQKYYQGRPDEKTLQLLN